MAPAAFERLFFGGRSDGGGRLCDLAPHRARALRDALDREGCGLLSAEALGLAVAMLAASAAGEGEGEEEVEQEEEGATGVLQQHEQKQEQEERLLRLRARLWRALGGARGGGEEGEDAQTPDCVVDPGPASVPLASAWTCALLMGAEERHLAAAWREMLERQREGGSGGGDDDENNDDAIDRGAPPPTRLTAVAAEALVAGAVRAQGLDPARAALRAPCSGFEWAGGKEEGGAAGRGAASAAVPIARASPTPPPMPPPSYARAAASSCCCVLS